MLGLVRRPCHNNSLSAKRAHTPEVWRRLSTQCRLVFPDSGICLWGGPLACAGRPARLVDNSARSEERGWEPGADGASAPPKVSDIGLLACSVEPRLDGHLREKPSAETSLGTADTSVRATIGLSIVGSCSRDARLQRAAANFSSPLCWGCSHRQTSILRLQTPGSLRYLPFVPFLQPSA